MFWKIGVLEEVYILGRKVIFLLDDLKGIEDVVESLDRRLGSVFQKRGAF